MDVSDVAQIAWRKQLDKFISEVTPFAEDGDEIALRFRRFYEDAKSDDVLSLVIRVHLHMEQVSRELLGALVRNEEPLVSVRLNLEQMGRLCAALGGLSNGVCAALIEVHRLRNRMAHRLHYEITKLDQDKFLEAYGEHVRDWPFPVRLQIGLTNLHNDVATSLYRARAKRAGL